MVALLVLLFIAVPIAEIAVIIKVGSWLGIGETIALLLLISVFGMWLVKRQGIGVLRRMREQTNAGRVPGNEIVDGVLLPRSYRCGHSDPVRRGDSGPRPGEAGGQARSVARPRGV